ncbi:MAG: hypothetical protein ACFFBT_17510 [Promethearchaeota archaeon]
MQNIQKYYFYRCYHCGEWYYVNKLIKTKKCWKCNRSFQFKKSTKFSKKCTLSQATKIIKHLKEKVESQSLIKTKGFLK